MESRVKSVSLKLKKQSDKNDVNIDVEDSNNIMNDFYYNSTVDNSIYLMNNAINSNIDLEIKGSIVISYIYKMLENTLNIFNQQKFEKNSYASKNQFNQWSCATCTLINKPNAKFCLVCNSSRSINEKEVINLIDEENFNENSNECSKLRLVRDKIDKNIKTRMENNINNKISLSNSKFDADNLFDDFNLSEIKSFLNINISCDSSDFESIISDIGNAIIVEITGRRFGDLKRKGKSKFCGLIILYYLIYFVCMLFL